MNQIAKMSEFLSGSGLSEPSPDLQVRLVEGGAFTCKYILGRADANAICCGAPTNGKSWCDYHRRIVYEPAKSKSGR